MSESELLVRRINDGTVIDHIDEGKGLHVLSAMGIDGKDGGLVTIALNVPSGKYSKKDIIKIEGKFLKTDDTNKLAIIAPKATINIIRGYKLAEKRRVALPDEIGRIFQCTNPDCTKILHPWYVLSDTFYHLGWIQVILLSTLLMTLLTYAR